MRRITTLRPGDEVAVHLRGRAAGSVNAYGGTVLDADAAGIRLDARWRRFAPGRLALVRAPASGQVVIPWARVDRVRVEATP